MFSDDYDSEEDDSIPGLQDRDVEDSSDNEYEDNKDNDMQIKSSYNKNNSRYNYDSDIDRLPDPQYRAVDGKTVSTMVRMIITKKER
jgi:hypothetical protein